MNSLRNSMPDEPEQSHENVCGVLVAMLRQCADYLAALPPGSVDALIAGDLELRLSVSGRKSPSPRMPHPRVDSKWLAETSARLSALESRIEGEAVLKEAAPTRAALEALARHLDIPIRKGNRGDDLTRRIIESTIGFRLASAVVQGRGLSRERDQKRSSTETHN